MSRFYARIKFALFLISCVVLVVGVVSFSPMSILAQTGGTYWNVERDASNNLKFYLTTNGTSAPTAVQISSNGNMGVGTTAPGSLMDLKGNNVPFVGQLRLQATDYDQITFYNSNNPTPNAANRLGDIYYDIGATNFVFENQVSNKPILLNPYSNGKVGINTLNPQRSLDLTLNGQIGFGNDVVNPSGTPGIFWHNDNTSYGIYRTPGSWAGSNYQQLMLNWPTGIVLDGGLSYGRSGTSLQPNGGNVGVGIKAGTGTAATHGKFDIYNSGANGDGAVFAPDINMDNNFTIQTYIDETYNPPASGWAGRASYASGCCNNLALQPDVGTVSIGGVSGNYGSNKLNVIGNANVTGSLNAGHLIVNDATTWAPLDISNNLNSCGQWSWNCWVRMMEFTAFGTWVGEVVSNNSQTVYGNASDYRLKENIRSLNSESALNNVLQIPVRRFNYKTSPNDDTVGFVAHELQPYAPFAVVGTKDAVDAEGKPIYQAVDYGRITPLLTAAVQELNHKIELLKDDNTQMQTKLNELENANKELGVQNALLKELLCNNQPQNELCR